MGKFSARDVPTRKHAITSRPETRDPIAAFRRVFIPSRDRDVVRVEQHGNLHVAGDQVDQFRRTLFAELPERLPVGAFRKLSAGP